MNFLFSGLEWFPAGKGGGLDRYFYEQIQAIGEQGHTGTAMVSSCTRTRCGEIHIEPMAREGAPVLRRMVGAYGIARRAISSGVDLINTHFALYAFPWLHQIPEGVPLIVNFQGPWADEMLVQQSGAMRRMLSRVARSMETTVYRRADRIITLSSAFRELLSERYGIPLSTIEVVPGALELGRYLGAPSRAEARERLNWPSHRPILVAVRRLAKRMGLDNLIDAVALLRRQHPEVLVFIGGRGPERERLEARIDDLALGENVKLLGFVPDDLLPVVYAAADCSIVPTVALEGFGLITAESLACGTPVLGTPVGATPEILGPLQRELVFESITPTAIADRINAVLKKRINLPSREQCRDYVARYGWAEVLPSVLKIYADAIRRRRENT